MEAGVGFGSTYPGTPVSDVGDILYEYSKTEQGKHLIFDYAINEKVALEEAIGSSWTGLRSVVIFKHLGMNVAADALHTIMYSGIGNGGGLIIIVGGDPDASSSTNAEDVRLYSKHTHLPILFPSTVEECYKFTKIAYTISEYLKLPVMVYTTPKLSFMTGIITPNRIPNNLPLKRDPPKFERNFERFVNARHLALENKERLMETVKKVEELKFLSNEVDFFPTRKPTNRFDLVIITGGYPYLILKDILSQYGLNDIVPILKLNILYPIIPKSITEFVKEFIPRQILVIEELEPMIENDVKTTLFDANLSVPVKGVWESPKKYSTGVQKGEITHFHIEEILRKYIKIRFPNGLKDYKKELENSKNLLLQREPTFCPGCSHRNVFYALRRVANELKHKNGLDLIFGGDIGCYTLGMSPPWLVTDWLICMGAGIGIANGVAKVLNAYQINNQHVVALIGDSTLFHSGITPLLNALKQNLNITLLVLNNYYVAMTGHQPSLSGIPDSHHSNAGFQGKQLKIEDFVRNLGTPQVHVVGGYDIPQLEKTFMNVFSQNTQGTRIIVVNAECALAVKRIAEQKWSKPRGSQRGEELYIQINESCPMCHECFEEFGCTAIKQTKKDGRVVYYIDESSCMREYCEACLVICPNHCIEKTIINPKGGETY